MWKVAFVDDMTGSGSTMTKQIHFILFRLFIVVRHQLITAATRRFRSVGKLHIGVVTSRTVTTPEVHMVVIRMLVP